MAILAACASGALLASARRSPAPKCAIDARADVQLFTVLFQRPVEFGTAILLAAILVVIPLKAAMTAESRASWTRRITGPNGKWFFGLLFVAWAVVFGVGLQLVPHQGADSPYGGMGLIALFSGFFIMMGFLWSVIGE